MRHTSRTILTSLSTLMGKPSRSMTTKQCPAPTSRAAPTDQPGPGRLAEGHPEPQHGRRLRQCLVQVFHRLDEVGLAEDQVDVLWLVDRHDVQIHGSVPFPRRWLDVVATG